MAFRRGGAYGLQKAVESKNTCTAVFSSGLQVTGTFTEFRKDESGEPVYIKTTGPSALSAGNCQLQGHGKDYHRQGFSSPVGKLKEHAAPLENLSVEELNYLGIEIGKQTILTFENGITVDGLVKNILSSNGKTQLVTFENCTVKDKDGEILF